MIPKHHHLGLLRAAVPLVYVSGIFNHHSRRRVLPLVKWTGCWHGVVHLRLLGLPAVPESSRHGPRLLAEELVDVSLQVRFPTMQVFIG